MFESAQWVHDISGYCLVSVQPEGALSVDLEIGIILGTITIVLLYLDKKQHTDFVFVNLITLSVDDCMQEKQGYFKYNVETTYTPMATLVI